MSYSKEITFSLGLSVNSNCDTIVHNRTVKYKDNDKRSQI